MSVGERILSLFRLFLLFTVLVAVALISAITTIRLTIHGHQETMPNLVGRPMDAAQRVASGLGLEIKVEGRLFDAKYPPDQIVSQVPPPDTRIKVGQHVHVLVSLGRRRSRFRTWWDRARAPRKSRPSSVGSRWAMWSRFTGRGRRRTGCWR